MDPGQIVLKKVRVHNLKGVDLTLEHRQLIVFTGVSGSGKSSLAFDTIYVEGQRRYIESLSTFARRHLGDLPRPEAESIEGISPTIAIEQKTAGKNPRSTVGTMTGIYDYMRVLFARIATAYCPVSHERVTPQSTEQIVRAIAALAEGAKLLILAPYAKEKKGEFKEDFAELLRKGFTRVRLDGKLIELTEPIAIDGKVAHDVDLLIDRIVLLPSERERLMEAVSRALEAGQGQMCVVNADTSEESFFSQFAHSSKSGLSYGPLEPSDFSFNHPSGMCPHCQGMGVIQEFNLDLVIDKDKSIAEDCCQVASSYHTVRYGNIYNNLARLYHFDVHTAWKNLSEKARKVFLYGTEQKWTRMQFVHPVKKSRWSDYVQWRGVLFEAKERFLSASHEGYLSHMRSLMQEMRCPACLGARIKPYPAAAQIRGKTIAALTALPLQECLLFFQTMTLTDQELLIGGELLKEIVQKLHFLKGVGLHYLALERTAPTLSGGEAQRVRLASQIGSGLVGATYVLDEPSIGLHPRDNAKLLETLKALRDLGNTVIVVEHDEETIKEADCIVDVGPLAGSQGGEILVHGSLQELLKHPTSLTGGYLSGRLSIPIPKKRRPFQKSLKIEKASHHNLKEVNVEIPLGVFVAVTGVSGSGKSSLISDTLFPALSNHLHSSQLPVGAHKAIQGMDKVDKVIAIDQSAIGRTPRSNAATYIKLFDEIRDLFCQLPESVALGYKAGRFSFNVKEGSCPHCSGMGMVKVDMDFMEDEWVLCPFCEGKRFDEKTLSVTYKGKHIHDILEMTVAESALFFSAIPKIQEKLETLLRVGLGYLKLGQPSPTLSGGEAQRIKLAKELCRPSTGKTFYILDEPTTGLHFYDIHNLIGVLQSLVDKGNTVLTIEHNMDLVKCTDWVIDLGPEGGEAGGEVIATGTPEALSKRKTPTAAALKRALSPAPLSFKKRRSASQKGEETSAIIVTGAEQNNLKKVSARIPRGKITVCTGPSGSGKSSFAFETVYAEGQRRYVESLSAYSRQFIKQSPKPKVESIEGLLAAIAIEQKSHAGNPRSTIGTMTETYDFLRVLFAHLGVAYCPETKEEIRTISKEFVVDKLLSTLPSKERLYILSPLKLLKQEAFAQMKERLQTQGYLRIRLNGTFFALDEEIPFDPARKNTLFLVIDRLILSDEIRPRLLEAVETAARLGQGTLTAATDTKDLFYNLSFAVESTGKSYPPITPHTFSFNTEQGMCLECTGLGFQYGANLARHPELLSLSSWDLILLLWKDNRSKTALELFFSFLHHAHIDPYARLKELSLEERHLLFHGDKEGAWLTYKKLKFRWLGLNAVFAKLSKSSRPELKERLLPLLEESRCTSCEGTRLNPLARHVKIGPHTIADLCRLSIEEAYAFLETIRLPSPLLEETLHQLKRRIHFLIAIGLGYLSLERSAPTLSGGETQRIRLARQLGSGLTGCLYVLDEPTIGLHPHDNALLNSALKHLSMLGNTLLLVEHDPMTLELADYLLDFGPKAGRDGGKIIASGTLEAIKKNPASLTGAYLSGRKAIPRRPERRPFSATIDIEGGCLHNLKNVNVRFPLGVLTCLTGVSGSGKSTLMNEILRPALQEALASKKKKTEVRYGNMRILGTHQCDKLLVLEQTPIGHTNRADVSTYVDLLTPLRYFFASLPLAQARGLTPKHFSFNHKKGMCPTCLGLGVKHISLQFLPPVKVPCEACRGLRLKPLSLQVKTKGKSLGEILLMTVEEAKAFLPPIPKVVRILDTLIAVGLGYLQLGQEIASLSGGEAQRIRLSCELAKRATGHTFYLLDEPTIGLHPDDIAKLLEILHALIDKGNSVILIEHNLDVIAHADQIIDLGPGSGHKGGEIVAVGTPEEIARSPHSLTGRYLAGTCSTPSVADAPSRF